MFVKKLLISVAVIAFMSSESYGMDEGEPQGGSKSPVIAQQAQDLDQDVIIADDLVVLFQYPIVSQTNWADPSVQSLGLVNKQWNRCLRLQPTLRLGCIDFSEEASFANFIAPFSRLTKLELEETLTSQRPIQPLFLLNVSNQLKQLELTTKSSVFTISADMNHLTNLEALTLRYPLIEKYKISINVSLDVSELTRLKKLRLEGEAVSPTTLSTLTALEALHFVSSNTSLDLQDLTRLTELTFKPREVNTLSYLTNLTNLALDGAIDDLCTLKNLKRLHLNHTNRSCNLGKDHALEELKVFQTFPQGFCPANLEDLTCLKKLILNCDMGTTNEHISHLTNLTDLGLHETWITEINSLTQLQNLYLGQKNKLSDKGYSNLSNLKVINQ